MDVIVFAEEKRRFLEIVIFESMFEKGEGSRSILLYFPPVVEGGDGSGDRRCYIWHRLMFIVQPFNAGLL